MIEKWKSLTKHEKLIIIMLIISVILVIISWDRIIDRATEVFRLYFSTSHFVE